MTMAQGRTGQRVEVKDGSAIKTLHEVMGDEASEKA